MRRKSVILWKELPESNHHLKPDAKAMSAIAMVRHVLEADYGWNIIINNGSMAKYQTPWQTRPYLSVADELEFAEPHRNAILESIRQFSDRELNETEIIHPGNGAKKNLGKYLLRIGYHEAVHAGQFRTKWKMP
nr:DinB family protein [Aequorivita vladivostokensis]